MSDNAFPVGRCPCGIDVSYCTYHASSDWPPAARNRVRPVAVYERGTDRLVAVFPNLVACYSVMPLPTRGPVNSGAWEHVCWEYADKILE